MNVCHTYWHVAPDQANQGQGIYEGAPSASANGTSHGVAGWTSDATRDYRTQRVLTVVRLAIDGLPSP
jgi:hypothetical protein